MKSINWNKIILIFLIAIGIVTFKYFELDQYLSLEMLKNKQADLDAFYKTQPWLVIFCFALIYICSTALSLPGATILTLAGGGIFGLGLGFMIVSFSSTVGATLAFLASRFLFREAIQKRFQSKLIQINEGIEKEGAFYLFTLRLVPIFPFFLINLVMGLTPIRVVTFFFVSQIGMIPGTLVYVNAGTRLAEIESLKGILSFEIAVSFALIGILPWISKGLIGWMKVRSQLKKHKKPKKFDYNMIVIGAGSGGLVSAYIAAAIKAKVALIEKHKMGGDCLNTGCVPSKALIKSAKVANYMRRAQEFGLAKAHPEVDFQAVMKRVQSVIQKIEPHDSVERYTGLGVDCISGKAFVKSPFEVEVNGKTLTTKNIVIATGASPFVPDLPGIDNLSYLTSDTLWSLNELPKELLILGGGPIGCELAQAFARLGSKVTLVEMTDRILAKEDVEVSRLIEKTLQDEGVRILTKHRANQFDAEAKTLFCDHLGHPVSIQFDQVLFALGRKANIEGFGLENLGLEISTSGTLVADSYLRATQYPNIYLCGDVTGPYQFTHTASHQAWFCAVNALFSPFKKFKVDYRVIPWCTFTDPEVARVGINEQEAIEQKIPYEVTQYGIDDLDRAITEEEAHGFVKVLTEPGKDRILGATIVGPHAGDTIAEFVTAMKYSIGLNKILGTIHIYPTFSESNKFAAGIWKKNHAPQGALIALEKYHQWRRGF